MSPGCAVVFNHPRDGIWRPWREEPGGRTSAVDSGARGRYMARRKDQVETSRISLPSSFFDRSSIPTPRNERSRGQPLSLPPPRNEHRPATPGGTACIERIHADARDEGRAHRSRARSTPLRRSLRGPGASRTARKCSSSRQARKISAFVDPTAGHRGGVDVAAIEGAGGIWRCVADMPAQLIPPTALRTERQANTERGEMIDGGTGLADLVADLPAQTDRAGDSIFHPKPCAAAYVHRLNRLLLRVP